VDTLVLGCTHYPLLRDVVGETMGPGVQLIDTGATCADEAARQLDQMGLLAPREKGSSRYFVSDSTQDFGRLAAIFLGGRVDGPVERIDIEKY
jgi:glutamate racemase